VRLPRQRVAGMAESDRLQPREFVAAAGAAGTDRPLVADQLAAALVKTGGRLIKHGRYYWLLLAEGHLTRRLFRSMLQRILALPAQA